MRPCKALWRSGIAIILVAGAVFLHRPEAAGADLLRVGQPAPEITGGRWINSEPLSMETLRGRVVVVVRLTHIGEGAYAEMEQLITQLLAEP